MSRERVSVAAFRADAAGTLRDVKSGGCVTVTESNGQPRMHILRQGDASEADLLAERDALLGIAQGPRPVDLLASSPTDRHRAQRVIACRLADGWSRDRALDTPIGQKRGPKPLPPEERAQRDRARWRAAYARTKAKRAQRAPEGPDADPM